VAFAIFIGGGFYQHIHGGELGYFLVGLFMALPCVVYPLLCPGDADKGRPLLERWVDALLDSNLRVCYLIIKRALLCAVVNILQVLG